MKAGLSPRTHNVLSYVVTLAVFLGVGLARHPGEAWFLLAGLWTLHFARRTLESAFVHVYSKPTIGWSDVLVEYVYYWGFASWISWTAAAEGYRLPGLPQLAVGLSVFAAGELGNAFAHQLLRRLRPAGSLERKIPEGFLFRWVSCPHYLCEVLSWVGFALASWLWGSAAFLGVGAAILGSWAWKRHRAYRDEFNGQSGRPLYPTERRALVPFLF